MNPPLTRRRRIARDVAGAATVAAAAMLIISCFVAFGGQRRADAAAAGTAQVLTPVGGNLTGGDVNTLFLLRPPSVAACAGDSATGGFRIQSYMISESISPDTLTFNSGGPAPASVGSPFRQPLFSGGNPYVDGNTAVGTGALVGIPTFDFTAWAGSYGVDSVPAGSYNVGIACWDLANQTLDKYWNAVMTFASSGTALTWSTSASSPTTTTTVAGAATTTVAGATTTTVARATTTTVAGATTTTVAGATTTTVAGATTTVAGATPTTVFNSGGGVGSGGGGGFPTTGSSSLPILGWGLLMLFLGRMTVLLGRPVRMIPNERN